jgi:hypothetical protein
MLVLIVLVFSQQPRAQEALDMPGSTAMQIPKKSARMFQNLSVLPTSSSKTAENRASIIQPVNDKESQRIEILEELSHVVVDHDILEFDYPTKLGPPKQFTTDGEYGYTLGGFYDFNDYYHIRIGITPLPSDSSANQSDRSKSLSPKDLDQVFRKIVKEYKRRAFVKEGFEVIHEKILASPEFKYIIIGYGRVHLFKKIYRVHVLDIGQRNVLWVMGNFYEDMWEKEKTLIKKSLFNIQWSPYKAHMYFTGKRQ